MTESLEEYFDNTEKIMKRMCNSVDAGIYTMNEGIDLFLEGEDKRWEEYMKEHRSPQIKIETPEGYEIWKYDIETFEPIFRKKR